MSNAELGADVNHNSNGSKCQRRSAWLRFSACMVVCLIWASNTTPATLQNDETKPSSQVNKQLNEDLFVAALRVTSELVSNERTKQSLVVENKLTALIAKYNLFILQNDPVMAHNALSEAVSLNSKLPNSNLRRETNLLLALFDRIDPFPDDTLRGLRLSRFLPIRTAQRATTTRPNVQARNQNEEILARLIEYVQSLTDEIPQLKLGPVVTDLISLRKTLTDRHPSVPDREKPELFSLVKQINLCLMYERIYLHMHNIQIVRKALRSFVIEPFSDGVDLDVKALAALTPYGKRELLDVTLRQVEKLLFGPSDKWDTEGAKVLIQLCIDLLNSTPQRFPRKVYFGVRCLEYLATMAARENSLREEEAILAKAAPLVPRIGDQRDRDEMSGFQYRLMAQLALLKDDLDASLSSFKQSIAAFKRAESQYALEVYGEMAQTYIRQQDYKAALDLRTELQDLRNKLETKFSEKELDRRHETFVIASIQAHYFRNDYKNLKDEIAQHGSMLSPAATSLAQLYLGLSILEETTDCTAALVAFKKGLDELQTDEVSGGNGGLNLEAGRCYERLGDYKAALPHLERAFIIDRNMRKSAHRSGPYTMVYANSRAVELEKLTTKVIFSLMQQPDADVETLAGKLLFYGEMAKSRGLQDELEFASYGVSIGSGISGEALLEVRNTLKQLGIPFYSRNADLDATDANGVFERYQKLVTSLSQKQAHPVVLVEYIPVEEMDRLVLFIIDEKTHSTFVLTTPWSEMVARVRRLRDYLDDSLHLYERLKKVPTANSQVVRQIKELEQKLNASSAELGSILFPAAVPERGNVADYLAGKSLILIPHGSLHNLSFASLKLTSGGRSQYLIEIVDRYAMMPSSSLLSLIATRQELTQQTLDSGVLIGNEDDQSLPGVGREFENIGRVLKRTTRVSDKSELRKSLAGVAAIHFGAHAYLDRAHFSRSGLSLKDGILSLSEIMTLKGFRPRIVTMGACESGAASLLLGDEVWSLQTAFLFAGAPAVVASLWDQDDDAASEFYSTFYEAAVKDGDMGGAFRKALLASRNPKTGSSRTEIPGLMNSENPCFWGGFNFIGQ
jgi:CHAT domain-containing protein/tetratricopeptide (TPR) repeat protein